MVILNRIKDILKDQTRSAKYKKNILLSLIFQVFSVVVSFLLVPVTLNYLGVEEYGVWITLTNLIAWFAFFDVGLGHGLRNKYAEAKAKDNLEDMKNYVSTAFFSLIGISAIIFIICGSASQFINWSVVLNAPLALERELSAIAFILISMFCVRFIVSIINSLLTADQEPALPVLINGLGNLISLIVVYIVTKTTEPSLLYIGIALSGSQLFPLVCAFIYYFRTKYKIVIPSFNHFSKDHVKSIFSLGVRFFLIQLTALVLLQGNNIIIAHICGLKEVSVFNIAFKYINIIYIVFATFLSPLWTASTDAYTRGDIDWIKNSIHKLNKLWLVMIAFGTVLVAISPFVYKLWLKDSISPDFVLLLLILLYFIFLSRSTIYRSFMNGAGKISLQFYVTMIQSVLHVPLAIVFGHLLGVNGVVAIMILWAFINSIWEKIQFNYIINDKAKGIWNR